MCRMLFNSLLTVIVSFVSCRRENCRIPPVSNGDLVRFEVKHDYNPYRWWTVHTKVPENTMVDEGKQLKLQCDEGYEPNASQGFVFTCREGRLSPEPQCVTKRCQAPSVLNGELQSLKNAKIPEGAFLEERQKIKLKCADGYQHSARSLSEAAITCWRKKLLPEPECTANFRCNKESLDYPGFKKATGLFTHGESFEPECLPGYQFVEYHGRRIYCNEGTWAGNLQPCTPDITKKKPIFYCSFNEESESDCARQTTSGLDKWEVHRNSSGHSCLRIVLNEGKNSTVNFTTRFEGKESRMCLTMHLSSGSVNPGQGGRSSATVHTVTSYPQSSRNHDVQLPKDYFEVDMDNEKTMISVSFFVLPGNPPQFLEIHRIEVQEGKCHPSGD